ncbi:hypothetical protein IKE67_00970 [bacterium]|nr:hypothetical protein [bacterium]
MGMAASQARYLGLTARKTNVEYEGQQINQARTALGNQSAALWNQMLGLSVPTVPSITDYTTLTYSFSDGINNYTITDMQSVDQKEPDGTEYNKLVTYKTLTTVYKGVETSNSNPQVQKITIPAHTELDPDVKTTIEGLTYDKAGDAFTNGAGDPVALTKITDDATIAKYLEANGLEVLPAGCELYSYDTGGGKLGYAHLNTSADIPATDTVFNGLKDIPEANSYKLGNSEAKVCLPGNPNTSLVDQEAIKQIIYDFGKAGGITQEMFDAGEIYRYEKNGNVYYTTKAELDDCWSKSKHLDQEYAISSNMDYQPSLTHYYATNMDETITSTDYALMDDASGSGRFANIKLKNMSTKFDLKAEETTNKQGYDDAMNQYYYDLSRYEKQLSDINAKTSLIQEQDRTLELRLKQLETEQKALSTEMEAVKGVLQKNVESTFGTFK